MTKELRDMTLTELFAEVDRVKIAEHQVTIVPSTGEQCDRSWLPHLFEVLDRDHPGVVHEAMQVAVTENAARLEAKYSPDGAS